MTVHDIPAGDVELEGDLVVPDGADGADGVVVFAHGAGSSRHSPRNNFVADVLQEDGHGTLLFDLLTEAEDRDRANRFDIDLLAERLDAVTDWLRGRGEVDGLPVGYFGSSTGAAAALTTAAERDDIAAVVSRGGRPDLAMDALPRVDAPTLLIVGGADTDVLAMNREARDALTCETDLAVVEGAGHLFEGEGELEEVAERAADWFTEWFA